MKPLNQIGKFATVVIDPPWDFTDFHPYGGGSHKTQYAGLSTNSIANIQIQDLLLPDANLFLWTTQRFLHKALGMVDQWGLTYRFTMVWHKPGGIQFPDGPASNAEFIVVAGNGAAAWLETKAFRTANNWPRGQHSEKPEGFYDLLRRITRAPRLDMFGRRSIAGFTSWGDQAPDAEPPPDHYQEVML